MWSLLPNDLCLKLCAVNPLIFLEVWVRTPCTLGLFLNPLYLLQWLNEYLTIQWNSHMMNFSKTTLISVSVIANTHSGGILHTWWLLRLLILALTEIFLAEMSQGSHGLNVPIAYSATTLSCPWMWGWERRKVKGPESATVFPSTYTDGWIDK